MIEPNDQPFHLVLATRNRKKGEEMIRLIAPPWESNPRLAGLRARTLGEFPEVPEVVEDGNLCARCKSVVND